MMSMPPELAQKLEVSLLLRTMTAAYPDSAYCHAQTYHAKVASNAERVIFNIFPQKVSRAHFVLVSLQKANALQILYARDLDPYLSRFLT